MSFFQPGKIHASGTGTLRISWRWLNSLLLVVGSACGFFHVGKHAASGEDPPRQVVLKELWTAKDTVDAMMPIAFSADGCLLITASYEGVIKVWNARKGNERLSLKVNERYPTAFFALHPKKRRMAQSASSQKRFRMWDLETGREMWEITPHSSGPSGMAISPDGSVLVTAGQEVFNLNASIKGWNAETGEATWSLFVPFRRASGLAFSPDGRLLAYAGTPRLPAKGPREIVLLDLQKREEVLRFKAIKSGARIWFSGDGKRIITAEAPQTIRVWDTGTGKMLSEVPTIGEEKTSGIDYSPAAEILAVVYGSNGRQLLWRLNKDGVFLPLLEWKDGLGAILSPDGKLLARFKGGAQFSVSELHPTDAKPELIAVPTPGKGPATLKSRELWHKEAADKTSFRTLTFDPRRDRLALADQNGLLSLWNARIGAEERTFPGDKRTRQLLFHPSGDRLASVGLELKVWDIKTGRELWRQLPRVSEGLTAASTRDGKLLATGTAIRPGSREIDLLTRKRKVLGEINLLDWDNGKLMRTIQSGNGYVRQLAFSGNGKWLAGWTGQPQLLEPREPSLHVWEVATGAKSPGAKLGSRSLNRPLLWVSDDGNRLITGTVNQAFALRDVETGKSLQRMAKLENTHLTGFAITADGRRLAAAYSEVFNRVVIWDPMEGQKLLTLEEPEPITHLAFSGDGKLLAYGNEKRLKAVELTAAGP